jgi:DNA-binding protein HU-beta
LNKSQFIGAVAERLDGDKKAAAAAVDAFVQTVYTNVAKGEKVAITGFGIFEKRDRAARIARNPRTGASVRVKKTSAPAFRAGAEFKAITSGARKLAKVAAAKKAPAKAAAHPAPAAKPAAVAKAPAAKVAAARAATATKAASAAKAASAKKAATAKAPSRKGSAR